MVGTMVELIIDNTEGNIPISSNSDISKSCMPAFIFVYSNIVIS